MLKWSIILAIVAGCAALLGFSGLAGAAAGLAKLLLYTALALCLLSLLLAFTIYWKVGRPLIRILKNRRVHADFREYRH